MTPNAKAIRLLLGFLLVIHSAFAHQRDVTGKRVGDTNYVASLAFSQSYIYGALNRLTTDSLTLPDPADPSFTYTDTTAYTHDPVGNRTQYDYTPDGGSPQTTTYGYDTNK